MDRDRLHAPYHLSLISAWFDAQADYSINYCRVIQVMVGTCVYIEGFIISSSISVEIKTKLLLGVLPIAGRFKVLISQRVEC